MSKQKHPKEPADAERVAEFLADVEQVWKYLHGVADGLQASGEPKFNPLIHRIRQSAHDLSDGVMYVRHGYKEPRE